MPYITDCIRSLQNQTFKDFEVVFVDGGSTDGTLDCIKASTLPYTLRENVRGGIAAAMNAGLHAAHGRYIAHLHADDYYLDGQVLADAHTALSTNLSAVWAFGSFMNDTDGSVAPPPYQPKPYSRAALLRRNLVPHCAAFVERQTFLAEGGFNAAYKLAMDYDLWLRLVKHSDPVLIGRPLAAFRRHANSATTKHARRSFNEDARARFAHATPLLWPEFCARYLWRRVKLELQLANPKVSA
jgi:glycosyltransferase involved in cell wall biosynthesis